jgi:hypothetical protein
MPSAADGTGVTSPAAGLSQQQRHPFTHAKNMVHSSGCDVKMPASPNAAEMHATIENQNRGSNGVLK